MSVPERSGRGETVTLLGSIASVIYEREENGYAVFRLRQDGGETVTVVGTLPGATPGETVEATGSWVTHPQHGSQFQGLAFRRELPQTTADIYAYLASGVLKGVGPATARSIVTAFGEEALRVLELEPERLAELKGIPERRAAEIGKAYRRQTALRRLMGLFADNGIRLSSAMRLYRQYGDEAAAVLQADPYILTDEQFGASFAEADKLALWMGLQGDAPERIEAATLFELRYNSDNGHCFVPYEKLCAAVENLIHVEAALCREALARLKEDGEVVCEDIAGQHAVYHARLYEAECFVAQRLLSMRGHVRGAAYGAGRFLDEAEQTMGLTLSENQRRAVQEAIRYGVFVLTGGPGTGKTTTLRAILAIFDRMGLKTSLAAPTGRAAKRMQELCGRDASTIHRLLETGYDPDLDQLMFQRDEDDPLKADAIILDEASMLDILLMQALLRAMKPGSRLILVGDADQLPSVGPGSLLRDLLRSEAVPAVRLTAVFRQAEQSRIIVSAHRINQGELPDLRRNQGDFFFLRRAADEKLVETVLELCHSRLPGNLGIDPSDIQVLSPSRQGLGGTVELNRRLQALLNPASPEKPEKAYGDTLFRLGDRVMQLRNNYEMLWRRPDGDSGAGIFNGDVGVIAALDPGAQTLTVRFEDRLAVYAFDQLSELELAYAMTVHKSQGSEYPAVVLALPHCAPALLSRPVLYTAVTRARRLLVAVGDTATFARMVENNRTRKRYSGLKTRLCAEPS